MERLSAATRLRALSEAESSAVDVLVIGGGVTGVGIALDAVARGYSVLLVEKSDFASGTSSKSTKLVHGGIRYLPNFDFVLVHEGLVERGLLLRNAAYLVHPLAFVLPIYKGDRHPVGMPFTTPGGYGLGMLLDAGLWMYDLMAGRRTIKRHRRLSRAKLLEQVPDLVTEDLKEGFVYYDAQTNDARLTLALVRTAAQYGAGLANYAEVTSLVLEEGQVRGAQIRDQLSGRELTVRARHIVNATGVYVERVESLSGVEPEVEVEPSKGVHLVFAREDLRLKSAAVVLPETEDKRILFIVPWESRIVFGTTDTGTGDIDHPVAAPADIAYLLKYLNRYLTDPLTEEKIVSAYAGYRPLFKPRGESGKSQASLSRTHSVMENASGLVTIVGGKLTTYRRMAQDVVDVLNKRDKRRPAHPTKTLLLQGSVDWPAVKVRMEKQGASLGLKPATLAHLGRSYGSEALTVLGLIEAERDLAELLVSDLPYVAAEVIYACRYEMALKPGDVVARRTSLILEDRQRGLGIVERVTSLMAREHGWSAAEQEQLVAEYRDRLRAQITAEGLPLPAALVAL